VLADHAAGVLAGSASFLPKAWRERGKPQWKLVFLNSRVANKVGERYLGSRN